jgi:hypothetical protein
MSGGSFGYAYSHVGTFAEDLELHMKESPGAWGPEVEARLHQLVADARALSSQMHAAEWLYSGDIGEDTFIARFDAKQQT